VWGKWHEAGGGWGKAEGEGRGLVNKKPGKKQRAAMAHEKI